MAALRVLVVDDDDLSREMLAEVLARDGHAVALAADGSEALRRLGDDEFDLVISDVQMARTSGFELLGAIGHAYPDTPVVLVTAYADPRTAMDAVSHGAADYLTKPVDLAQLRATIGRAIERRDRRRENARHAGDELNNRTLLGTSVPMIELYKQIAQVAATNATVYIQGESGSGKELVARTIHERSARAASPFVAVNCAALTESLLESELFGHEKGAFTGASATRHGLFEAADGGTLFLDEIGDVTPKLQAQLLRVLQEGQLRRVGGTQELSVDVRLITATNRDLAAEMAAGRIRADLFYRLSVVALSVPPLRERGDDLVTLAKHFAARHASELGRGRPELTDAAIAVLRGRSWPGNVRELENAMARAVAMCRRDVILPSDLPPAATTAGPDAGAIDADWPTLEVLERRYIEKVLVRVDQNKTAAAQVLGIDRRTLQRMPRG
ncbi:MAG TPA: sigma-54 dependent transcriptional regulator [Kofleriaceae bacterium]|jgi:DNA-binding NtrC family response regulator